MLTLLPLLATPIMDRSQLVWLDADQLESSPLLDGRQQDMSSFITLARICSLGTASVRPLTEPSADIVETACLIIFISQPAL